LAIDLAGGAACKKGPSTMNAKNQEVAVNRALPELAKVVTLPATPTEVWFEQVARGRPGELGPTDYLLVAVLRFQPADLARIAATAHRGFGSPPRISATANRPWFPAPVRAAIRPYDDRSATVAGTGFDAASFASSSFPRGQFIALEGGEYIILVLETT
jgi:hypothetical protein